MRTFYIFKINDEYSKLTKNNPYNLFMILNGIYKSSVKDLSTAYSLFDSMNELFKKDELKISMRSIARSENYQNYGNIHTYHDYYNNESSKLIIHNSYLILKTNAPNSTFFNQLHNIKNAFVCDFENNDYFWLTSLHKLILV